MICGTNCDGILIKAGVFSDFLIPRKTFIASTFLNFQDDNTRQMHDVCTADLGYHNGTDASRAKI